METDSYDRSQLEEALAADDAERRNDAPRSDQSNTDAIETGPIDLVSVEKATSTARAAERADDAFAGENSSESSSPTDAYTPELDFSTLEAAESGEITPLTQRRPSSSAE